MNVSLSSLFQREFLTLANCDLVKRTILSSESFLQDNNPSEFLLEFNRDILDLFFSFLLPIDLDIRGDLRNIEYDKFGTLKSSEL